MNELALCDFRMDLLDELVVMWRQSFEDGVGIADPHPLQQQRDYFLSDVLPNHRVVLGFRGDRLVGFVAACSDSVAQLHVRVGYFRQGIGSRLLAWAQRQSNGSLWLYTFARNQRARQFYERRGFRAVAFGFEPTWQLDDVRYEWQGTTMRLFLNRIRSRTERERCRFGVRRRRAPGWYRHAGRRGVARFSIPRRSDLEHPLTTRSHLEHGNPSPEAVGCLQRARH